MVIKKVIKYLFRLTGLDVVKRDSHYLLPKSSINYSYDMLYTYHNADFMNDPKFIESYNLGKATDVNKTVLNNYDIFWRIHVLCWAATHAKKLEGDFVDCGVNTGIFSRAVINYIDFQSTSKQYFLLDTFSGLDERYSSEKELNQHLNVKYKTHENTLYEQVQSTFKNFNVTLIKGAVPDTLPLVTSEKICYLSVDMNCVQPEIDALNFFWDKLVPGGLIILDDYGYGNDTLDQREAHKNFAKSKGVEILSLPTCQGLIIKPPYVN
jgi:O-methyltransferase